MRLSKWVTYCIWIILFLSVSPVAIAQNESGLRLGKSYYESCKVFRQWSAVRKNRVRFSQCAAYALGVMDTFQMYAIHDEHTKPFCVPKSVNTYRLLMEVIDGMESRIDQLDVNSALVIMTVIRERFPCNE